MPVRYPGSPWRVLAAVLAVAAVALGIAVVAAPSAERGAAAERTAVAQLRELVRAQQRFAEGEHVDTDANGEGEFGYLGELSGGSRLRIDPDGRLGHDVLQEPVLPLSSTVREAAVDNGDYLLRVYLPGTAGSWVAEADDGGGAGCRVDPKAAERSFRAYAWPVAPDRGVRAFFVDQSGTVRSFANTDRRYEGRERPVPADAVDIDQAADTSNGTPAWVPLK